MNDELKKHLESVKKTLCDVEKFLHASRIVNFDLETICPSAGMEEQGEVAAFLSNKAFALQKSEDFLRSAKYVYEHRDELDDERDKVWAETWARDFKREKNITSEMQHEFSKIYNKAYVDWYNAKKNNDFASFVPSLSAVRDTEMKRISLIEDALPNAYDNLLDMFERGMTSADLDKAFGECTRRLVPLLKKIMASKKKIRTDFLSRTVTDEQQKKMAQDLLEVMGYDFSRGAFTTTEHPFTDGLGKNDVRVTTHYQPNMFASSMFSIIHEGGHALFDMNQPTADHEHFITGNKTMGMHESVSRFYENRIGRSEAFIHLIYPKVCEIFPNVMSDVSEKELFEAMNIVEPSLIRTEADEFTYTFHVIIRYEIEKLIVNGGAKIEELRDLWNKKYEEYLGVTPSTDSEGILQDVHWSSGFGYFPTYAVGNMYNAMYYKTMSESFDIDEAVRSGDFAKINGWMKENVFKSADILSPKDWLFKITGKSFSPDAFLDYLEEKYSKLYEL